VDQGLNEGIDQQLTEDALDTPDPTLQQ